MFFEYKVVNGGYAIVPVALNVFGGMHLIARLVVVDLAHDLCVDRNRVFTHIDTLILTHLNLLVPVVLSYFGD